MRFSKWTYTDRKQEKEMLDFRVDTFLCVCRHMNYTKASEELNITQPAVSQHIKYLEHYYGTRLFMYENKKLYLTSPGKILYERLNTLKDRFDFIYPSHANPVLEPNIIEKLIEGTKAVIDNKLSYSDASLFGQKIKVYDIGCAKLLLN